MSARKRAPPPPPPYEEEEEDVPEYDDEGEGDYVDKDKIIEEQRAIIAQMRKHFAKTIDSLQRQLNDLVDESTSIQSDMLKRIKELKDELKSLRGQKTTRQSYAPKPTNTAVRSSLYGDSVKHPRKLASQQSEVRTSRTRK